MPGLSLGQLSRSSITVVQCTMCQHCVRANALIPGTRSQRILLSLTTPPDRSLSLSLISNLPSNLLDMTTAVVRTRGAALMAHVAERSVRRLDQSVVRPFIGTSLHCQWQLHSIATCNCNCNCNCTFQVEHSSQHMTTTAAVQSIRLVHPALGSIAANFDACLVDARAHARCLKSHDPVSFV